MATYKHRASRARLALKPATAFALSTSVDELIGQYRRARDYRRGYEDMFAAARARIGEVNQHKVAWRLLNQREAFGEMNRVRSAMRQNERTFQQTSDALISLGYDLGLLVPRQLNWLDTLIPSEGYDL